MGKRQHSGVPALRRNINGGVTGTSNSVQTIINLEGEGNAPRKLNGAPTPSQQIGMGPMKTIQNKPTAASIKSGKMSAYLLAVTADGGVPLMSRKTGDLKTLPFALAGTLNGINLFGRLQGAQLLSTATGEAKTLWRLYHDSVVLIVVTNHDVTMDNHLSRLLDNVFAAMVLLVGLERLKQIANVDRLKRDLKACYHLVDHLIQQLDQGLATIGDLTGTVDCLLCPEALQLENYLEGFTESAESDYGCLLVRGKVAVATKKWWSLTGQERVLLSGFINSSPKTTTRDVPVFLPTSCPKDSNRLLTFHLVQGVDLCFLCGPNPLLEDLEEEVPRFWKEAFETLKSVSSLHPRNVPSCLTFDKHLLGFLLVNERLSKSLCSVHPSITTSSLTPTSSSIEDDTLSNSNTLKETRLKDGNKSCVVSLRRRQEMLRLLYKIMVGTYFPSADVKENDSFKDSSASALMQTSSLENAVEAYVCMDNYKSYSLREKPYQLFLVFSAQIPTYAMRSISHQTLKVLTTYKAHHF